MAAPNTQEVRTRLMVAECARCERRFTDAAWRELRLLSEPAIGASGHAFESRSCSCGSTISLEVLPVRTDLVPTPEAVEARLRNRIAALEADLATSARYRQKLESENAKLRHQLWLERSKARAANQAPNPPGNVVTTTQDTSDPTFTTLRKVGTR